MVTLNYLLMIKCKQWIEKILIVLGILFIASIILIIVERSVIKSRSDEATKSKIIERH